MKIQMFIIFILILLLHNLENSYAICPEKGFVCLCLFLITRYLFVMCDYAVQINCVQSERDASKGLRNIVFMWGIQYNLLYKNGYDKEKKKTWLYMFY